MLNVFTHCFRKFIFVIVYTGNWHYPTIHEWKIDPLTSLWEFFEKDNRIEYTGSSIIALMVPEFPTGFPP